METKDVTLEDFSEPRRHRNIIYVTYRTTPQGEGFVQFTSSGVPFVFHSEEEFIYHFKVYPDVIFQNLPVREAYCEPDRTILRLSNPINLVVRSEVVNKLYVRRDD